MQHQDDSPGGYGGNLPKDRGWWTSVRKKELHRTTAFGDKLGQAIERDMDKFSAEQALDAHDAYYKVSTCMPA